MPSRVYQNGSQRLWSLIKNQIPPFNSIKSKNYGKTNSPFASAYMRFLQLAKVIQALPSGMEMDANESALLQAVVLRWYENKPMKVREAIGLADLGSPATLHKRITRLRGKDMLSTLNLEGDRRAKFLIPTERTLDYFSHLGQSMQQAHQSQAA